jgi:hypothetical protein
MCRLQTTVWPSLIASIQSTFTFSGVASLLTCIFQVSRKIISNFLSLKKTEENGGLPDHLSTVYHFLPNKNVARVILSVALMLYPSWCVFWRAGARLYHACGGAGVTQIVYTCRLCRSWPASCVPPVKAATPTSASVPVP